jgi:hypothetical protein
MMVMLAWLALVIYSLLALFRVLRWGQRTWT